MGILWTFMEWDIWLIYMSHVLMIYFLIIFWLYFKSSQNQLNIPKHPLCVKWRLYWISALNCKNYWFSTEHHDAILNPWGKDAWRPKCNFPKSNICWIEVILWIKHEMWLSSPLKWKRYFQRKRNIEMENIQRFRKDR